MRAPRHAVYGGGAGAAFSSCALLRGPRLALALLAAAAAATALASMAQLSGAQVRRMLPASSRPPLRVAAQNMWLDAAVVLAELESLLVPIAWAAGGVGLIAVDVSAPQEVQLAAADVILFGPYGDRNASGAVARAHRGHALTVFIGGENQWQGGYHDQMVPDVHIALGHRRDLVAPNYMRLPWWLPYVLDASAPLYAPPRFSPRLRRRDGAAAWAARPRAAALLSSHAAFPRRELFELFNRSGLSVDAPGKFLHNTEWPAGLPNHHLRGKVEFLERYRYNICPENSRSGGGGGYNTEKLPQALMAGAVPVYWGDPIDADVFNVERVIEYDGVSDASVMDIVVQLETDAAFREQWFSRPVLVSAADAWMGAWFAEVVALWRAGAASLRAV